MNAGVKAGKLANGFERGKGKVVHALDGQWSMCGTQPANQWSERELIEVNCPKCIRQLRKDATVRELLGQVDEMVGQK